MAIDLSDVYTGNANPASSDYPHGSFKNSTGVGTNDGTPLDQQWANDFLGFFQAILHAASVTPSGTPDTALASQYLTALRTLSVSYAGNATNAINATNATNAMNAANSVLLGGVSKTSSQLKPVGNLNNAPAKTAASVDRFLFGHLYIYNTTNAPLVNSDFIIQVKINGTPYMQLGTSNGLNWLNGANASVSQSISFMVPAGATWDIVFASRDSTDLDFTTNMNSYNLGT